MTSAAPNPNQANQPPQHQMNNATSPQNRRDLKSWWKGFKLPSKHQDPQETRSQGIFGVPLRQSITYANVAISLIDEKGQSYIYGYVPIVVAKCGVFLKEKATGVEGIFRLSGSEKRIKELKTVFDSPDRYGKGLVWDGYTVHDAANVLRRYLNDLPEPVVPLDLYEKFRDPLRGATKQAVGDLEGPQFVDNFNEKAAIERYQQLITELPPLNRQLLLYILDLLAVFAAKADENRMNSQNLAAIFQPGMLSHPAHAMAPEEYRLNQCVIIFLIENQDHFLIGMQGTAADEKTKKEVESGTPSAPRTPNPNRSSSLDRSASNASAGAASVRRDGKLRRNRSVSSRNSRNEGTSTPNSPALTATPTTGGLARSNTVPSKKSPALAGGRFQRQEGSSPRSPAHLEPLTQLNAGESVNQSPQSTRSTDISGSGHLTPTRAPVTGRSQERLLEVPQEAPTPTKERNLPSLFRALPSDNSGRQPNKLKKKRIPGSLNPSAHSSNASLQYTHQPATSPNFELPNPMEYVQHHDQEQHVLSQQPQPQPPAPIQEERHREQLEQQQDRLHGPQHPQETQLTPPASLVQQKSDVSSEHTPRASQASSNQSLHPENTLKSKKSPPTSLHSSFNEGSDLDQVLDEQSITTIEQAEKEKKKRWRLSRSKNADNGATTPSGLTSPRMVLGLNENADVSNLSISSSSHRPRKSESSDRPVMLGDAHSNFDSGRDNDSKGPIGWIRNKYREAKESAEQRRNKSPPADRTNLSATSFAPRGKSLDIKRDGPREGEKQASSPPAQHASLVAGAPAVASAIAAAVGPTFAPTPSAAPVSQPATITLVNQVSQQQPRLSQLHAQPQPPAPQQYQAQAQHQPKPQPQPEPQVQQQPQPHQQQSISPPVPQPTVTQASNPAPAPAPTSAAAPASAVAPVPQSPQQKEPQDQPQPQPQPQHEQQQEKKPEEKPVHASEQPTAPPPAQPEQPQSPQTQPPQPQSEPTKQEQ
ncbi:GTPase activating protein (GAP) for Rho1p [Fusarium piperis]|uniref:GTPase activating protein (GAP) for Rho1p n=1 Tax=Fusarium piperis TaxID=1435070 RepID=A0A9W8W7R7_9HYPO|nr:GTPase activating protein (GAP) for Rho1p [Fusarium piperis]